MILLTIHQILSRICLSFYQKTIPHSSKLLSPHLCLSLPLWHALWNIESLFQSKQSQLNQNARPKRWNYQQLKRVLAYLKISPQNLEFPQQSKPVCRTQTEIRNSNPITISSSRETVGRLSLAIKGLTFQKVTDTWSRRSKFINCHSNLKNPRHTSKLWLI
jgi:hypothetical protein